MKTIDLTAIDLDIERDLSASTSSATAQQVDDLERPVPEENQAPATTPASMFYPVTINPADVREFYPRKGARTGTRIVYMNGAARPVKETYAEVKAKFDSLNN